MDRKIARFGPFHLAWKIVKASPGKAAPDRRPLYVRTALVIASQIIQYLILGAHLKTQTNLCACRAIGKSERDANIGRTHYDVIMSFG